MKNRAISYQFKRASEVIKSDRIGVSSGIEGVISSEVQKVLDDFFALNGEVTTLIDVENGGYKITIEAKAKSVKQLKIIG